MLDATRPRALNRNRSLRMEPDTSVRGWDVLTRDAVSVERGRDPDRADEDDEWLTIRSRAPTAPVGAQSRLSLGDVERAPLTAVVVARAFGRGRISASLTDPTRPGGSERAEVPSERSVPA